MEGGLLALGFSFVIIAAGAFALWRSHRNAEDRQIKKAIVDRRCEECGTFVQSDRSRAHLELEGVMGWVRVTDEKGRERLEPRTFNQCDRCARFRKNDDQDGN